MLDVYQDFSKGRKRLASDPPDERLHLPSKKTRSLSDFDQNPTKSDSIERPEPEKSPIQQSATDNSSPSRPVERAESTLGHHQNLAQNEDHGEPCDRRLHRRRLIYEENQRTEQPLSRSASSEDSPSALNSPVTDALIPQLTHQALQYHNDPSGNLYMEESPSVSEVDSERVENLAPDEPKGTINAYSPNYLVALEDRGIYFADDEPEILPENFEKLSAAIFASRTTSEPGEGDAARLRILMRKAPNESATVQSILPKILPIEDLEVDKKSSTVPEQKWQRSIMIEPDSKPSLTTVKPDRTIGWSRRMFEYQYAMKYLGPRACPIAANQSLVWPLFTVEVKGDKGNLKVARLQNLHNAATMLSNLLYLKRFFPKEKQDGFFNKVHVMSLELTAESIQLSCYWATRGKGDNVNYYGMKLRTWTPYETSSYREAHRCVLNALEYVKVRGYDWICSDMEQLEATLKPTSTPLRTQSHTGSNNAKRLRSNSGESCAPGALMKKSSPAKVREG